MELFDLSFDEEPGGSRPDRIVGVRPQEQVQRHTVEQMADSALVVLILDVPVPLLVEQVVDVLQFFGALLLVVEQFLDVPKIILEDIPPRISAREPQLAEQLVEVPTILNFLKQTVDIPVPRGVVFKVFSQNRVILFLVEVFKVITCNLASPCAMGLRHGRLGWRMWRLWCYASQMRS